MFLFRLDHKQSRDRFAATFHLFLLLIQKRRTAKHYFVWNKQKKKWKRVAKCRGCESVPPVCGLDLWYLAKLYLPDFVRTFQSFLHYNVAYVNCKFLFLENWISPIFFKDRHGWCFLIHFNYIF